MLRKFSIFLLASTIITGCSSPPEPAKVGWGDKSSTMNDGLPSWQPNNVIVHAQEIKDTDNGRWSLRLTAFDTGRNYPPEVYYVVAHSLKTYVRSPNGNNYLIAKKWLRYHGYTGDVVAYRYCKNCTTDIFFIR